MPGHDVIVIGASAGGVEALSKLVAGLPADLPAALFVVVHIPSEATSVLPRILSRAGPLPAVHVRDGLPIQDGRIYVAPPDYHLLLRSGHVRVVRGPREHGHRPAVDPLFRSAAHYGGPRTVGVILSGVLDDGTSGLQVLKAHGGVAVVQDPDDAFYDGMPRSAVENVDVDHVLPLAEIAPVLARLAHAPVEEGVHSAPGEMEPEAEVIEGGQPARRAGRGAGDGALDGGPRARGERHPGPAAGDPRARARPRPGRAAVRGAGV